MQTKQEQHWAIDIQQSAITAETIKMGTNFQGYDKIFKAGKFFEKTAIDGKVTTENQGTTSQLRGVCAP